MNIVGIIQARMSSTRLPGKVLMPLHGKPMIVRQIERLLQSKKLTELVVATSVSSEDDRLAEVLGTHLPTIKIFRGSLDDVLDRFHGCLEFVGGADHIVRLTADCPLADPQVVDQVISFHLEGKFDYSSNQIVPTFPDGLDVEVVTGSALKKAWQTASLKSEREHVTLFHRNHPEIFKLGDHRNKIDFSHLRWTVDEEIDFQLVNEIYGELLPLGNFGMSEVLELLERRPELREMNNKIQRNEGLQKSLLKERYKNSEILLERAQKSIPLGTQTFSKSKTQFPKGASPFYITKGAGSRVWDVDGNEYIDFINSLCAITLGYRDKDVDSAVQAQLSESGVVFSLPHSLEIEVSEQLQKMIPCAEMVRFGKNGSDATSGAIRLARAYTERDRIATCGYHGWQDWYIGSTPRNRGVPVAVRNLTHSFRYNDLDSLKNLLESHSGEFAAVILEPMNSTFPQNGFLEGVKELTHKHGALLIFDETITGFRFASGGAQEYFGVTPDLATFGKGMANGYPLSAIVGKAEYMRLMEEIFFSFTFGGETLSLAASLATLKKLSNEPVIETLWRQGKKLQEGIIGQIGANGMSSIVELAGSPVWSFLTFKDTNSYSQWQIKTLFLQEMFKREILTLGTFNISYSHTDSDIQKAVDVLGDVFEILKDAILEKKLEQKLECEVLQPLFRIR